MTQKAKLSTRQRWALVLLGLAGQIAWCLENMYFNVYLYNNFSTDPRWIAAMVAASAAVATLTTLLVGALSDRLGKRKAILCGGYVIWGLSLLVFGWLGSALAVVIMDCVMTFFGSSANDACFNAWVTDITDDSNRGRTESILAVLPLAAVLIVFGLLDSLTQSGRWLLFFALVGGFTSLCGLLGFGLVDEPLLPRREEAYFQQLLHGFRPSVIKENASLYLALCALMVFSVAVQVYYPYIIIYIQNYLGIDNYALVLGIVLVTASAVSILCGRFIDRAGKLVFVLPAAGLMLLGLVGMYFARQMLPVILWAIPMMAGHLLVSAALSAQVRDLTPPDKAGHFQGIRMIFAVLIPMVAGPFLGSAVIRNGQAVYMELGVTKTVPTPAIFLAAAVVLLLCVVPILLLKRRLRHE